MLHAEKHWKTEGSYIGTRPLIYKCICIVDILAYTDDIVALASSPGYLNFSLSPCYLLKSSFSRLFSVSLLQYNRDSWSLQNLVAISQDITDQCWSQKEVVKETVAKMAPQSTQSQTSSQSEGHSSKWLIWLVCREPLKFLLGYLFNAPLYEASCWSHKCTQACS